jgi:hypothetical protein
MDLFNQFNAIINALNKYGVEYILIGGYAVILHGLPRTTQDMDIVLKMTEENIDRFQRALKSLYDDQDIEEISISELKKYAVIRYGTPDNFYIDIMAGIGEAEDFDSIESEIKRIGDISIKVATPEDLYRMKNNTIRPHDKGDALFLKELIEKKKE